MEISKSTLEFPSIGKATGGDYENGPGQLTAKSSLQDIVTTMLKGKTLDKPTVIVFHTTHDGKPDAPYRASKKTMENLSNTDPRKGGLNAGLALHFGFDVFTSDVGAPQEDRNNEFKWIGYKRAPLALVVDTKGRILGKTGGTGSEITPSKIDALLASASKKLGVNLAKKLKKELKIIEELTAKDKKLEGLRNRLSKASGVGAEKIQEKIDAVEAEKAELEKEEKSLWAWPEAEKET